ncbi:MAG: PEP-CTERM sorting domain-containing protein [Verrucomicrobia bacterium]|nr:PEP-CTERM sorting domain-containing protein [Verrucomicrobiota bacterium]MCH8512206.1 PEP-CTERM sorting domain-containing protein [Kiritimatiellia bacterium]
MKTKLTAFLLTSLLTAATAHGAILFTGNYTQDFNTLPTPSTNGTVTDGWDNNVTLPGWYVLSSAGNFSTTRHDSDGDTNVTGSNGSVHAMNIGPLNDGNRSLGARKRNNTVYMGVNLQNNTATTLSSFTVQYTGEQWRSHGGGTGSLDFAYSTDATALNNGTWTSVSALDFQLPVDLEDGTVLDGRAAANREVLSASLGSLSLDTNETVWFRWDAAVGNNGNIASINDFSVTAIPEPGTLALLGIALGTLALFRNRRR